MIEYDCTLPRASRPNKQHRLRLVNAKIQPIRNEASFLCGHDKLTDLGFIRKINFIGLQPWPPIFYFIVSVVGQQLFLGKHLTTIQGEILGPWVVIIGTVQNLPNKCIEDFCSFICKWFVGICEFGFVAGKCNCKWNSYLLVRKDAYAQAKQKRNVCWNQVWLYCFVCCRKCRKNVDSIWKWILINYCWVCSRYRERL